MSKAIKTKAEFNNTDLIINGSKHFITNGHIADWICLLVNTNNGSFNTHLNKSLICVNLNEPGVFFTIKINFF